jgi:H+/gluconate symporter-like permease
MPPAKDPKPMVIAGDTHWSIDKRIPLAVVFGFAGQILVGVVFATQMHSMIKDHEKRIERLEAKDRQDDQRNNELSTAVIRLQEAALTLREAVAELRRAHGTPR